VESFFVGIKFVNYEQPQMIGAFVLMSSLAVVNPPGAEESRLILLARQAVVSQVTHRPMAKYSGQTQVLPVFVTIEVHGSVRGCRGDLTTRTGSLESEVIRFARAAAAHDPRYRPLQVAELRDFKVTVTLVDRTEPLADVSSLRPDEGLVLERGDRTGVVLPFEGRDATTRLHWAFRKAGVPESDPARVFRLIARRFRG
jgi:AMMECR1 domain-containing protein